MLFALAHRLKDPPIIEVVCGFFFAPLANLDPLVVGKYWAQEKENDGYDERQLHPAVFDRVGLSLSDGIGPLRSWLIKDTKDYVLQFQRDRFYFNWRKHQEQDSYPHFADRDGTEGVLTKSIREFNQFQRFCEREPALKQKLTPLRLELAKVDLLVSPTHWKDYADLASVVPMLSALTQIEEPTLNLSLIGQRGEFQVNFTLTNASLTNDMSPAVKIETRVTAKASEDVRATMSAMNDIANEIFFSTVKDSQRFGGEIE